MKHSFYALALLVLILLAANIAASTEPSYTLKTYIIDGNRENTQTGYNNINKFVIGQKQSGRDMLVETIDKTRNARQRNLIYQQRDEDIDKCIKKITKNWKRTYYRTSYEKEYDEENHKWVVTNSFDEKEKTVYGYDEEEDLTLKHVLRDRALSCEKIC